MARYQVGNGTNWSSASSWATSSGGAAGASVPTATDDVIFDGNSKNCTIDATAVAQSLTCTGYTGTLTQNGGVKLTVSGNVTFVSGMTYSPAPSSTFAINASSVLTTGGKLFPTIQFTSGTLTLGDNLSFRATSTLTFQISGTALVLNGCTVSGNSVTNRILIQSNNPGTLAQITVGTGTFANADFMDIAFSSASNVDLSAITGKSGNCGGNTITGGGSTLTFTTPATQAWNGNTTGNWSTAANWTSRVPLPQDNVSISGLTSGTITADMPRLGTNVDCTGSIGGTLSFGNTPNSIFGNLQLVAGLTISGTQALTLGGRGAQTLTSAGLTFTNGIGITAPNGTYTLVNNLTSQGVLTLTRGTLDATTNNVNVSCSSFSSSNTGVRQINMGTGTWTLSGTGTTWTTSTATNLTVNAGSSLINCTDTSSTAKTVSFGGLTFNNITFAANNSGGMSIVASATVTFGTMTLGMGGTYTFTHGKTYIFTTGFIATGSAGNIITIISDSSSNAAILSYTGAGTINCDYLSIKDSNPVQANTWYPGAHSSYVSNYGNWVFILPGHAAGLLSIL